MSNFGFYDGRAFLDLNLKQRGWMIENILKEKDSVMFLGSEKSGKSLFIFQMICSLTTRHPFLDKYDIPKERKVVYVQLEGELEDSQDRMKRMVKTIDFEPSNFLLYFSGPLSLQMDTQATKFKDKLQDFNPDVVIIDPVYFSFDGSLNDDLTVRKFIGNIRKIKEELGCAIVMVHHTHKSRFDYKGKPILEGDDAIFGSKFLKAYPDHLLYLMYHKINQTRTLSCETQRGGDILPFCNLRLVQPDPLYYEVVETGSMNEAGIITLLMENEGGFTAEEAADKLKISKVTFYRSVKPYLYKGIVYKSSTRPVKYLYNREAN